MRDLSVVMEVVAILLPPLALGGTVALALAGGPWRRSRRLLAAAVSWHLFAVAAVAGPWLPHDGTEPPTDDGALVVAVANTLDRNDAPEAAARDILALDADVVVAPEMGLEVHAELVGAFEHVLRPDRWDGAVAVYSNVPVEELDVPPDLAGRNRVARVDVDGRFVLWAIHPPRPWITPSGEIQMRPGGHARVLDALLRHIEEDEADGPVVIAGDLNLTDRGRGYRRVVDGRRDAMTGIRGGRTSVKPAYRSLFLRIDHIVVPRDWCADGQRRFDISGSDHRGVTARIGPCPEG